MANHVSPRDARPASVERAEERTWIGFYERVDRDPALAIEIMALLDSEPDSKRRLPALYLTCKQSVRHHKAREARDRRKGELVRLLIRSMIVQPLSTGRRFLARVAGVLAACVPISSSAGTARRSGSKPGEPRSESASRNVQRLPRGTRQGERDRTSEPRARAADAERSPPMTEAGPGVASGG